MDSIAHSLWSFAVGRTARSKARWWVLGLIGAGPDLVWLPFTFVNLLTSGNIFYFQGPYNVSHSLIPWLLVSLLLTIRWRRTFYYTWPWALHIVIDIPGHQDMLTPIFWPISSFSIHGWFDWLSWPIMVSTYAALFIFFLVTFFHRRRKKSLV